MHAINSHFNQFLLFVHSIQTANGSFENLFWLSLSLSFYVGNHQIKSGFTKEYLILIPGNQRLILSAVIHHLDHKNVSHDPQIKSNVIQIATSLAQQIRSGAVISDVGFVSDLSRHLRKSLQATIESVQEQELNLNS